MKLTLAQSAGFCYGVQRAVELAQNAARSGGDCVMLGPIIHNDQMIARLAAQGVGCISAPEQARPGQTVIIRSHGEGRETFRRLEERGAKVLDATCPNVVRIHQIVAEAEQRGRQPVIIGTPTHPEITAIAGWCAHPVILEDALQFQQWLDGEPERRSRPITMVSQTTSTREIWEPCIEKAKKECTNAEIFDTICGATAKRQREAQRLAAQCEVMVVIGDPKSSNTRRLAELCEAQGAEVLRIETADDLRPGRFSSAASVSSAFSSASGSFVVPADEVPAPAAVSGISALSASVIPETSSF